MHLLNQDEDNIESLVKSLRPIKYLYSKQNKVYDKYFHGSSLKDLINQINSPKKFNEFLQPGESLEETNKEKTIMDINFKSTFNYIDELSNLKNLPILLSHKPNNHILSDKKILKKNLKIIKMNPQTKNINLIKTKIESDDEVTLDPGRYHPNYDYIKRRYPCVYFGKYKNERNNNNEKISEKTKNEENDEKKQKLSKKNLDENKNKINCNSSKMKNKSPKKNVKTEEISKNVLEGKKINNLDKQIKSNFNLNNYYSLLKKDSSKYLRTIMHIRDKFSHSNLKEENTASSFSNTMDFESSKKLTEQLKYKGRNDSQYNYSSNNFNIIKRESIALRKKGTQLMKNSSLDNLRCPIIFDKMKGRDKSYILKGFEGSKTTYNPKYNSIRPHIPSIKFKSERKYKEFKKYIIGKIIRSYCFNPEQYFVFEYKENKENEISGKYRTIVLKS